MCSTVPLVVSMAHPNAHSQVCKSSCYSTQAIHPMTKIADHRCSNPRKSNWSWNGGFDRNDWKTRLHSLQAGLCCHEQDMLLLSVFAWVCLVLSVCLSYHGTSCMCVQRERERKREREREHDKRVFNSQFAYTTVLCSVMCPLRVVPPHTAKASHCLLYEYANNSAVASTGAAQQKANHNTVETMNFVLIVHTHWKQCTVNDPSICTEQSE